MCDLGLSPERESYISRKVSLALLLEHVYLRWLLQVIAISDGGTI